MQLVNTSGRYGVVSQTLHWVIAALLVALPLSGWLASSAEGGPTTSFGLTTLPAWNVGGAGEDLFEEAHEVLGNVLLILVILHALAALKHHFVDKDDVLLRMLPASSKSARSSGDRGSHAPQGTA